MPLITIEGHTLHARFLTADSVVIDLGANRGGFSGQMAKRFGCRCLAVEANPAVLSQIPADDRISRYQLAIAGKSGMLRLSIHEDDECSSLAALPDENVVGEVEVTASTLEEFVRQQNLDFIDVVKIDIEGSEVEVLDSCSDEFLRRVGQMSLELHDFTGQVSLVDVQRILHRLETLGFVVIKMARKSYIDTLAINRRHCPISFVECLYLRHWVRNWHGLKRMAGRWLGAPPPPNARPAKHRV
jgi:FkbM family methyltransferase